MSKDVPALRLYLNPVDINRNVNQLKKSIHLGLHVIGEQCRLNVGLSRTACRCHDPDSMVILTGSTWFLLLSQS